MTSVANWPFQEVVRHSRSFVDEKPLKDEESLNEDVVTKGETTLVVGSTDLFDEFGQIRLIPVRLPSFLLQNDTNNVPRCRVQTLRVSLDAGY